MTETYPASGPTATIDRQTRERLVEPGDHERLSHYAPKDKIMEAMITGVPLIALCGKVWIPTRDPERFPVCAKCKEVYENMPEGPSA